jgi:hypothetical protein
MSEATASFKFNVHELIERVIDAQRHIKGYQPDGKPDPQVAAMSEDDKKTLGDLFRNAKNHLISLRDSRQSEIATTVNLNEEGQDPIELTMKFAQQILGIAEPAPAVAEIPVTQGAEAQSVLGAQPAPAQ